LVLLLERHRPDPARQTGPSPLRPDVEQVGLVALLHQPAGLHPHLPPARAAGVGPEVSAGPARPPPPAGLHDHVADLPGRALPLVDLPVEHQAPADSGPDPDPEQVPGPATRPPLPLP